MHNVRRTALIRKRVALVLMVCVAVLSFGAGMLMLSNNAITRDMPVLEREAHAQNAADPLAGQQVFVSLAERLMPATVNISTSTAFKKKMRQVHPFQGDERFRDFFGDDFFDRFLDQMPQSEMPSKSLGSGFIIDREGYIITNNHVIEGADEIKVKLSDKEEFDATIVGRDKKTDIALIKITPPPGLPVVTLGDSDALKVGEWVMAIGNPFGLGGTLTVGVVSARNRNINSGPYDNFIHTDAAINRGNSGGPLFNMAGDVIGINTAIFSQSGGNIGIAFAVPANTARPVVAQLREFGETRRGWLGVRIQEVTDEIAESLSLGGRRGALIAGVEPNGPAGPAGIKTGDVIVRFDGREVRNSRELPRIVSETAVGKAVPVTVVRAGKEEQLTVTLGRREGNIQQASTGDQPRGQPPRPQNPTVSALGLQLSGLTQELLQRFSLREDVRGVVVTQVDPNSRAAERSIEAGNVIIEVQNEAVTSHADVTRRIEDLRREGRSSALFLVANAQGDRRFVALTLR